MQPSAAPYLLPRYRFFIDAISRWTSVTLPHSRQGFRVVSPASGRRLLSLGAHHLANVTDDDHQDAAAYTAAGDLADDRSDIQPARHIGTTRRTGCHTATSPSEHPQKLAAESAADDARQAVPQRSEIELLQQGAYDVATRRAGYERDNKAYNSRAHFPDPLSTDNILICLMTLRNIGV